MSLPSNGKSKGKATMLIDESLLPVLRGSSSTGNNAFSAEIQHEEEAAACSSKRSPGVIARLMGLDQKLPPKKPNGNTAIGKKLPSRAFTAKGADGKDQRLQDASLYGEIEKRLRKRGIEDPSRDLSTLKEIVDSMQAKGLLHHSPAGTVTMKPPDMSLLKRCDDLMSSIETFSAESSSTSVPDAVSRSLASSSSSSCAEAAAHVLSFLEPAGNQTPPATRISSQGSTASQLSDVMSVANSPVVVHEKLMLTSLGIAPRFVTSTHITMESDKYLCIRETSPQNRIVIIDMAMPTAEPLRLSIVADSALINPNTSILALKVQIPGTAHDHMQIFNIESKTRMKKHMMCEVVFWKWITPKLLGLVTQVSVYHWSIEGDAEPIKMFDRTANLTNTRIINYRCDPTEKWLVLIGLAPDAPERPHLVKGDAQLFCADKQCSQALGAHAACFATFKVPGNENLSTLICYVSKAINAGNVTSELHVVELGARTEEPGFSKKQVDLFFTPRLLIDAPLTMQFSQKYGLIYIITKLGFLFVYDLETAAQVYRDRITSDPIFLTAESCTTGGFYAIDRRGQVLHATINDATIVPFLGSQLNNLKLAENLAKRANLPGPMDLIMQRFQELFSQAKYKEAAELVVEFSQGLLRTPETVAKFKSAPLQLGQVSPLLQYFATLLTRGKLNAYESLELSRLAINQNGKNLLEGWLADDKLECSEELGNLVKTVDDDLALKIYIKARENPRVVGAFNERREFDNIIIYPNLPEKASILKGPGERNYKVYNGEGSIFSSNITPGPSSGYYLIAWGEGGKGVFCCGARACSSPATPSSRLPPARVRSAGLCPICCPAGLFCFRLSLATSASSSTS